MTFSSPYKQLTVTVLVISFLIQTFSRTFIVTDYYTNTTVYARDCINKNLPMMHCNGQCQMIKKLQEQEKKEQESPERKSNSKIEVISSATSFASIILIVAFRVKKIYAPLVTATAADRSFDIFHPPGITCFAS